MKLDGLTSQLTSLGHEPTEIRGKVWLDGNDVSTIVNGLPISFTRRRYSNTTFCWAKAYIAGEWVDMGDPWQKVTPSKADLENELERMDDRQPRQQWLHNPAN